MREWFVLISYFMCSMINGMAWVNLVPIPDEAMSFYNITEFELTLYSYIFFFVSVATAQISNYMVAKSLFYSLHLSWVFLTLGCWLRVIAGANFWISFTGQSIITLNTMMLFSANSVVATLWFPESRIVLATSIASASNFIGIGISFITMVNGVGIMTYMWVQAILSSAFFLLSLFTIKSDPPLKREFNLWQELLLSVKDKNMMIIVCCTASVLGVNYAIITSIGVLLEQVGYGMKETGLLGFILTMSGMVGALIATYLAEVRGSTKNSFIILAVGTIVFSAVFSAVISVEYANYIIGGLYGACILGTLPLGIRASVEYMNEVHDSVPSNLIYLIGQTFSCAYVYPILYLHDFCGVTGIWIGVVIIFLSYAPLLWFISKVNGHNFYRKSFRDD